jgi:hypothetical protein
MSTVLTKENLTAAIAGSSLAAEILREAVKAASQMFCPESYGWEGRDTFPPCDKCFVCLAKQAQGNTDWSSTPSVSS